MVRYDESAMMWMAHINGKEVSALTEEEAEFLEFNGNAETDD